MTLDQLADEVNAQSRDELAMILGELTAAGLMEYELQVRSPHTNQPLRGFKTFGEIPKFLPDKTTDSKFEVSLDDVRPIYFWHGRVG
ncbi:MAG: hypothetical protein ABII82_19055 [Verrucomicrobiota bacterium]